FHYEKYMSDMLVPLLLVSSIYFFIRVIQDNSLKKYKTLFVLSLSLLIYTEYIGLLVAGCMFLFAILNFKQAYSKFIYYSTFLISILVTGVSILQYVAIGSMKSFASVMIERYTKGYKNPSLFDGLYEIVSMYWSWFVPMILFVLIFLFLCI